MKDKERIRAFCDDLASTGKKTALNWVRIRLL